ncbi:DUF2637 domain-containing protein [Micromonospora peucetia]|uniref:DUF2637 domain-containing protein n=1 Tax=Micromonospora peucetia TaxID=47871 RepID=A0A1C6VL64_9ACTN|nr:DUF2637 domain-containing protein [Micromonospora peucetia]SCL66982.1 Protein of unknown function (DUF2637) [Micromonospora peucetia]
MTMVGDLTGLASNDRRVARELAAAERERLAVQQRIAADNAAADRRLRTEEGRLRLDAQRDRMQADRRERRRVEREAARAAKRERRQARRREMAGWYATKTAYVRDNAAAVYSGLIYGLAVSGAVYGQVDAARANNLPTPVGVVAAVAIEGTGLAMALTAQQQRLKGERAMLARSLVWVCTAIAVGINAYGHGAEPVKAAGLSVLSALGIIVYEVRSGAKHRKALREAGMIPEPPERFGWRRWLTYFRPTVEAWKLDVRDRLSPGAADLIARAEARRAAQRREALVREVADRARKAATKATRKGDAGAALAALVRLASTGTPAPLLALPSPGRAEADAARADAADARRAQARAEAATRTAVERAKAEAARRAEVEANAAAIVRRAEADALAAVERAEAEAARRVKAEADAATAVRRAEAEAANVALARQAEADARQALQRLRTEAEAARTDVRSETARAARTQGQLDAAQAEWQQRLQAVDADAGRLRRELAVEREARHRAEARVETISQEAEGLRAAVAQAAAEAARKTRRNPTTAPTEVEPVLLDGKPVPLVDRVSAATVLAVLEARRDNPEANQKQLAALAKTSDRTVRKVFAAAQATASS